MTLFLSVSTLELNCGFITKSAELLKIQASGVCSLGYSGGFGLARVKTRCGSRIVAWITGTFMTLGVQGSQQHYRCRRYVSIRILFYPLAAGAQKTSLAGPSLLSTSGLQRATLTGVFLPWSAAVAEIGEERKHTDALTRCT